MYAEKNNSAGTEKANTKEAGIDVALFQPEVIVQSGHLQDRRCGLRNHRGCVGLKLAAEELRFVESRENTLTLRNQLMFREHPVSPRCGVLVGSDHAKSEDVIVTLRDAIQLDVGGQFDGVVRDPLPPIGRVTLCEGVILFRRPPAATPIPLPHYRS